MRAILLILLLTVGAWAQTPTDDDFWVQRILSSAQVVAARLDHASRITCLCIRRHNPTLPTVYKEWPYGIKFVVPSGAPTTPRVRAARAQAAGTITAAWLRYTAEINAACLEVQVPLKFTKLNTQDVYLKILGDAGGEMREDNSR